MIQAFAQPASDPAAVFSKLFMNDNAMTDNANFGAIHDRAGEAAKAERESALEQLATARDDHRTAEEVVVNATAKLQVGPQQCSNLSCPEAFAKK